MKRLFILTTFLLGISPICLNAQELTLEECQQQAQAHYPLIKRYGLIEKTKEYNISNAGKGYLPQVSLSAKASYQSDVTEIPVDLPGIDIRGIRKDQYQAMLQLDQVVWDGGNIRARKEVTRATSEVDKQKLEVDMYAINERVNQLFFGILLLKEQLKQNQLMQEELQRNYDNVTAYVKNGIANQADLDAVKVEQLNNIQQRHTLEATYRAYSEMLKIMINHPTPLTENTLKKPDVNALLYKGEAYSAEFIRRPELNLFAAQNQQLEAQRKQLTAKNLPRLGIFVQGAYGNPGLNMLKNEFSPYYIAGVRLSWNFGSLYTLKNDRKVIENKRRQLDNNRDVFLFNTRLEMTQQDQAIQSLEKQMQDDDEIIRLRTNIRKSAEAKVANGTLTVTEMLRELTNESLARQSKALHEIQRLMGIYQLKYTTND